MKQFIVDNKKTYTYQQLLLDIQYRKSYYKYPSVKNLYEFYCNLIFAIIHNRTIVFDDTIHENDERYQPIYIDHQYTISSVREIISAIKNSSSELILYTSGTTGRPKEIKHSISNLIRSVKEGNVYSKNVWALAYHPSHMAGLLVFFQAFLNTCTITNLFNRSRKEIMESIEQYSITNISATPTFYRLLLPFEKEFGNVSRITFGGEKSGKKLHDSIKKIFPNAKVNNIYASTEAGFLFKTSKDHFQITDDLKNLVRIDNGELLVHKSLLGVSETLETGNSSFYRTGDLVEIIDASKGFFKFKSRKNEMVNVGGYKINPNTIENVIQTIPEVKNTIVYGRSNSVLGNVLCCDIEFFENTTLEKTIIRKHLSSRLQNFEVPRKINFVEHIELTKTGKTKRK